MKSLPHHYEKDSFTLVELLVVIGILAILTAAVVIALNPSELLKQSRDSKRMTDLANLNNAIKLLMTQSPDVSLGSASTVYVSLADSSSTCGSYALPALPSGWKYQCATAANYQKADGTGWIPVNFANGASQLSSLPSDPQNDAAARLYYAYAASNGRWELASAFESGKYAAKEASDGGVDPAGYEAGSNTSLMPFVRGLVAYWPFDEGSGSASENKSGIGTNAVLNNSPAWRAGSECRQGGCLEFTGSAYGMIPYYPELNIASNVTYSQWIKAKAPIPAGRWPLTLGSDPHSRYGFRFGSSSSYVYFEYALPPCTGSFSGMPGKDIGIGSWHMLSMTYDGSTMRTYVDGMPDASRSVLGGLCPNPNGPFYFDAADTGIYLVDEPRIYSRALSDAEIQALYNAAK
jgi:type II secretory pathway pseudopilin PulG